MITFKKSLAYGTDENISKDLLTIRTFKLSGDEKEIKKILDLLSKIKRLYQFNIPKTDLKSNYDYFFWSNVNANEENDYSYITLDYNYHHSVVNIISEMLWLLWYFKGMKEKFNFEINIVYEDIHKLVDEVEERVNFETDIKNKLEEAKNN